MSHQDPSSSSPLPLTVARPTPPQPRRVPPPCWTHEETVALIDSYHEKWYSLRRGNLKASHWQEVADAVARKCPFVTPSKTSVQCRHKVEKLRKRYRTEKQRAAATTSMSNRFSSSWVFFKKMDNMEKGPSASAAADSDDNGKEDEEDDDEEEEDDDVSVAQNLSRHHQMSNGRGGGSGNGSGSGFRFRIPSGPRSVPVFSKNYARGDGSPNPNFSSNLMGNFSSSNPTKLWSSCSDSKSRFGFGGGGRSGVSGSGGGGGGGNGSESGGKREMMDPVAEMVSSIKMLGEGFVKMEQMKMEMAKEMEQMRMEMEMKRTEMILDSQQRIVEAFAKGFSARKKVKRMPTPES